MSRIVTIATLLVVLGRLLISPHATAAAEYFRSFDGPELCWQLCDGRPGAELVSHGCVGDDARQGSRSERLTIAAPGGEALHFVCPVGRVWVMDEFEARMWAKANRPGVALAARVVLPRSVDEKTGNPRTVLVTGDECRAAGRWQQLRLAGVPQLLAAQARALRAAAGAKVDVREAYVDAVILVVPGGPDPTVAWTDALEIDGIVVPAAAEADPSHAIGAARATAAIFSGPAIDSNRQTTLTRPPDAPLIQFQGTTLLVAGRPFLPRGIHWNNEPLAFLAAHGFNTIWLDEPPTPDLSAEAARADVWLIAAPPKPEELASSGLGASLDRVLAWHLGRLARPEDLDYFRRWAKSVRDHDPLPSRPIIIAPRGDWLPASRLADVLLADHPASSRLSQADFAGWLEGLPRLARPGSPLWVALPTQPGPRARRQAAVLAPATKSNPLAIDDEQLDSLAVAAASGGARGLLFQSDSPLDAADPASQRRAAIVERLNERLELMAPWLTVGKRIGELTSTDGSATAVVLRAERARLVVPTSWAAAQNRTASAGGVTFIVPGVPDSNEAYLLSPVGLQTIASKRVAGGVRVSLERYTSSILLLTEDPTVVVAGRERVARLAVRAAQRQYSLAQAKSQSLAASAARLQRLGVSTKTLDQALTNSGAELGRCNTLLGARSYEAAYQHASAALRSLSDATDQLRGDLITSPSLDSNPLGDDDDSLAQRAEFGRWLAARTGGENQLVGGDFESLEQLRRFGWKHVEDRLSGIETKVQLTGSTPHDGRYALELSSRAVPPDTAPQIVARPLVWITSPPNRAAAGEVVEITGWIRVSDPITGSIDGLEIIDSLGGHELALRVRRTDDWQPFRMIRGVNDPIEFTLTFALHGIGTAQIDGVMIRSLSTPQARRLPATGQSAGPLFPNSACRELFPPPAQR